MKNINLKRRHITELSLTRKGSWIFSEKIAMDFLRNYQKVFQHFRLYSVHMLEYFQSLTLGFDPIIERQDLGRLLAYSMPDSINYRYAIFTVSNIVLFIDTFLQLYFKPDNVPEEDLVLFHQVSFPISGYNQQMKVMFMLGYIYLLVSFAMLSKDKLFRKRDIFIASDGKLMRLHNQKYFPTTLAGNLLRFRTKSWKFLNIFQFITLINLFLVFFVVSLVKFASREHISLKEIVYLLFLPIFVICSFVCLIICSCFVALLTFYILIQQKYYISKLNNLIHQYRSNKFATNFNGKLRLKYLYGKIIELNQLFQDYHRIFSKYYTGLLTLFTFDCTYVVFFIIEACGWRQKIQITMTFSYLLNICSIMWITISLFSKVKYN